MDFIIRKDIYGNWWHDYNNNATKVNISDFEAVIDDVENTFIIQCFNGSNVPSRAISIVDIKVIDQTISNTPIPFSGAVGLKNLLTTKSYPPYRDSSIVYDEKVVFRKGHAVLWNETQEYFDNNFDVNGLGINLAIGWGLCNGLQGRKNFSDRFILNKGNTYPLYQTGGSANAVLIGHSHETGSYGVAGEPNDILVNNVALTGGGDKLYKYTKKKGISNNGISTPDESGVGKNMPPYIVAQWVERTEDLIVYYTGSEGGVGSQDWSQTLENGRFTGGFNPLINDADAIDFENGSYIAKGTDEGTGGNGGIEQTCSIGYKWKWEAGEIFIRNQIGQITRKENARYAPTVNDDDTKNFIVNAYWEMYDGTLYTCTDNTTGAAAWEIYISNVPNLTQVLNRGDRAYVACNGDYQFVGSDIASFLINDANTGTPIFTIDGDNDNDFITNCVLKFQSYLLPSQLVAINGAQIYVKGEPSYVTTYDFNIGDLCELKKLDAKVWWLNVSNTSNDPIPTKTSDLINDGADGVNPFITLDDIPPADNGLPIGGTAGQILTKLDSTDYNAIWQENYADWTSVVKHRVKNDGTGLITKGTAVYVTTSNGTNMLVGKASNTSEATSSKTMGLMQTDIPTTGVNSTGFVITEGLLSGLNTAGQTAGDPVWLGVNGALIYGLANKPYAPAHLVFIGIVTKVSAGSGEIFVKIQNGFELKEIHDVDLISNSPTNNQGLIYESATSLWKNKTIIEDSIANAVTDKAPSQNAVFDALALKQDELFDFNTRKGFNFFEDFLGNSGNSNFNSYGISTATSGTGAQVTVTTSYPNRTNQQGVVQLGSGTLLSGLALITLGSANGTSHYLGNGVYTIQTFVNIETLSTSLERFYAIIGSTTVTNLANTNGIFFIYDEGGIGAYGAASANFKCVTSNALTRTITTTSTPVVASQWYNLKIVVNANASSVEFFIDGTSVATHTTNIPTVITPKVAIQKTVGITNRNMFCDYLAVKQIYTNPR